MTQVSLKQKYNSLTKLSYRNLDVVRMYKGTQKITYTQLKFHAGVMEKMINLEISSWVLWKENILEQVMG